MEIRLFMLNSRFRNPFKKKFFTDKNGYKDFKKIPNIDNEIAARIWGKKKFNEWKINLSSDEIKAIYQYTQTSRYINPYLRKYKGKQMDNDINVNYNRLNSPAHMNWQMKYIDSALKKSKLTRDIYLYRRVSLLHFYPIEKIENEKLTLRSKPKEINKKIANKLFINLIKYGNENRYKDFAYVSTSLSQDPRFVKDLRLFEEMGILLKIKVPKGTKAAFINEISAFPNQNEVLIGRNYIYKYNNISIINTDGIESLAVELELEKS